MHEIAAVAQDDAHDALHKGAHHDPHEHGDFGVVDVGGLIFVVQLFEGHQLLGLLHKGLDHRDAGEALLREIRKLREALLPVVPLFRHHLAHNGGAAEEQGHGNQRQSSEQMVHPPHFHNGEGAQNQRIKKLHEAPAEALLDGVQIVGEQAHEITHLIHLVVFPAELLGVAEHSVPQVGFHPDGRPKDGHPPQKPAEHNAHHHGDHGHADFIQQERHVESMLNAVKHHIALVHAVDDHPIQLRNHQLQIVHRPQGQQADQQQGGIAQVIAVDVLAKNHILPPFSKKAYMFDIIAHIFEFATNLPEKSLSFHDNRSRVLRCRSLRILLDNPSNQGYNKNTGRCALVTHISLQCPPRRLPQSDYKRTFESTKLKNSEPSGSDRRLTFSCFWKLCSNRWQKPIQ